MPLSYVTTATEIDNKPISWVLSKGELVPIEYIFPPEIDLTGHSFVFKVGDTQYPMTITGQSISLVITSAESQNIDKGTYTAEVWNTMPNGGKQVLVSGRMHVR